MDNFGKCTKFDILHYAECSEAKKNTKFDILHYAEYSEAKKKLRCLEIALLQLKFGKILKKVGESRNLTLK